MRKAKKVGRPTKRATGLERRARSPLQQLRAEVEVKFDELSRRIANLVDAASPPPKAIIKGGLFNIYRLSVGLSLIGPYDNQEIADKAAGIRRIACIRLDDFPQEYGLPNRG